MKAFSNYWRLSVSRLQRLEDRNAPAAFNTLVSRAEPSLYAATASGDSYAYDISADGRFTVFLSTAPDVVPGQIDTNNGNDVFLYDRVANTTVLVTGANGSPTSTANGISGTDTGAANVAISADGRYVTFVSKATNLVPDLLLKS